jgi:flagellar basal body-associated protein FliL
MSDYDPKLDKPVYDDAAFEPRSPSRGLYLVVGVVAAIVAAVGLMFFSGNETGRSDLARNPDPAAIDSRTNETRTPAIPRVPPGSETTPAAPATPGPARQP